MFSSRVGNFVAFCPFWNSALLLVILCVLSAFMFSFEEDFSRQNARYPIKFAFQINKND